MTRIVALLTFLALAVCSAECRAERTQLVEGSRILLGELVSDLQPETAAVDVGAAPKAGSSRLLTSDEINRALRDVGEHRLVSEAVRVVRASKRWSQQELVASISPAIRSALPEHATLLEVSAPRSHTSPSTAAVGRVELAALPRRRGTHRTTAIVAFDVSGKLEQRLSIPIVLELGAPPEPVKVERGQSVMLSVARGQIRVSATAVMLQTAEVGTTALCRVLRTKKVLRARLLTASTAEAVIE